MIRVVLFGRMRVAEDWCIPPRTLSEHLIYFVLQGGCEGLVDGYPIRLQAHSLLWVPPGIRHQFWPIVGSRRMRLYHLRFVLDSSRGSPVARQQIESANYARPLFDQLFDTYHEPRSPSPLRFRALLASILGGIPEGAARPPGKRRKLLTEAQKEAVEDHLEASADLRLSPRDLARAARISPDYFARLFANTYGISPKQWIARSRVHRAAELLLETPLTISEIADRLGYPDLFTLSHQFSAIIGQSPRDFRQTHGTPDQMTQA